MDRFTRELRQIHEELKTAVASGEAPGVKLTLESLEESAERVGLAWSGSWVGYQANVYYAGLKPPPIGVYFDKEFGLDNRHNMDKGWELLEPAYVIDKINEVVNQRNREEIGKTVEKCNSLFDTHSNSVFSILHAYDKEKDDPFLNGLVSQIEKISVIPKNQHLQPPQTMTRDSVAMQQGFWTPPHIDILIKVDDIRKCIARTKNLMKIVERAMAHMNRVNPTASESRSNAGRVFIGHGRSPIWRELKDFLEEDLGLSCDEYNRVSTEGIPITIRLGEMLDHAYFAFLIMTAEDEQANRKMQARMNVIHEAGLFQGRLGFDKAIILLEEGCEQFSNIHGLGHLPFRAGDLQATFHRIRKLLTERGIVE